ncbi:hypothetical protein HKCCE3408_15570 [Rhodobacterales bacterium HKCCE3408]|nr:hypothetical protein [Rhodobacterales bacterium HKCCE3408]
MKLKVTQDAEAPADRVYAAITDFRRVETELAARGVALTRAGGWTEPGLGRAWSGRADIRGKTRRVTAAITGWDADRVLEITASVGGMGVVQEIRLVPLGHKLTRVGVMLDLRPDTLSARLLLQSLKLARKRVLGRIEGRLSEEIARVEREVKAEG